MVKLLDILAEAISAEKEQALRDKFVQEKGKTDQGIPFVGTDPNKISEKEFKELLAIDETPNGTYLNWIILRYSKLNPTERKRFFNDEHNERVKELLTFFNNPSNKAKLKKSLTNPKINTGNLYLDINQYKTLEDFENAMAPVQALFSTEETPTGSKTKATSGEPLFTETFQYIEKIGTTSSGYTVYKIPTSCRDQEDKGCFREYRQLVGCEGESDNPNLARPALTDKMASGEEKVPEKWVQIHYCTRFPNQFSGYLKDGPYYVFVNWNKMRIFQLHYESGQIKDENNKQLDANDKLRTEFLQFVLDKDGRIPPQSMSFNLDLSKFKVGAEGGFPIYKVGPLYYIDAKTGADQLNKLVYFDDRTGLLKNVEGNPVGAKAALREPYIYLMIWLANNNIINKETITDKDAWSNWMTIRIMGNINIPETAKPVLNGNINVSGTAIKVLPANLTITGDLNISNTPIKSLPPGLKVGGVLDVRGTGLKVPSGVAGKVIQD